MIRINTSLKNGRVHTLMHDGEWITIVYTFNQTGEAAHISSAFSTTLRSAADWHLDAALKLERLSCQKEDTSIEKTSE